MNEVNIQWGNEQGIPDRQGGTTRIPDIAIPIRHVGGRNIETTNNTHPD